MNEEFVLWVGIDWGNQAHQVCVLDQCKRVLVERSVKHSGEAIDALADELVVLSNGEPSRVAASIETTWGAIVDTLLERSIKVFSINPKQLDRFRDRYTVAGAKDDRRDAFVLADALRTDDQLFQRLGLEAADIIELRELVRVHEDLKAEVVAHGNRLSEQLHRFFPQVLKLGSVHTERWLWELVKLVHRPDKTRRLSQTAIETILTRHRIRRLSADQVLDTLRSPPLHVRPGVVEACEQHISMLLPRLELAQQQRIDCEQMLSACLTRLCEPIVNCTGRTEPSDAAILMSMPGVGTIVGATMLAEASQLLADHDLVRLRTQCGTAPVTKQSGKSKYVIRRLACNPRLRQAVYHWSRISTQNDSRCREHYTRLRAVGHSHGRALRGVADRLLSVLVSMLRNRALHDPGRRQP